MRKVSVIMGDADDRRVLSEINIGFREIRDVRLEFGRLPGRGFKTARG